MLLYNLLFVEKVNQSTNLNMNNSAFYGEDQEELFSAFEDSAAGLKFRSVRVDGHSDVGQFAAYTQHSASFGPHNHLQILKPDLTSKSEGVSSGCPSAPFGICKTSFNIINTDCASLMQRISDNLSCHANFDFSLCDGEYMWKGKYLCGSSCFELEVNLYHDMATNLFTLASRKISGDCAMNGSFNEFYTALKTALCNDPASLSVPVRKVFCIPKNCSLIQVSDEEFLQGVQCIFSMCDCTFEARIQAAKMLCDVSLKAVRYLELPAFLLKCVSHLELLLDDDSDDVRQYAVMAIGNFAELKAYQDAFINSTVLTALFGLVENCQYETAQMRRTAAKVLSVLCCAQPVAARDALMRQRRINVPVWLQRVAYLMDARARDSSLMVKAALAAASLTEDSINPVMDDDLSEDDAALLEALF